MKVFNSIEDQITKLKQRGVVINDEEYAKDYLLRNNYYCVINSCSKPFLLSNASNYIPGTNFSEIVAVHQFEREIKHVTFKFIIEIEQHLRSIISHIFCQQHNQPYDCININSYNFSPSNINDVAGLISQISKVINKQVNSQTANSIKHYSNHHGDVPYWVLSGYLTFGSMINVYKLLENSEKRNVISSFERYLNLNLGTNNVSIKNEDFLIMLNSLLDLRNVVAHNSKLFGFKCRTSISYTAELHDKFNIGSTAPKQDYYNMIVLQNCFLTSVQFAQLYNALIKRCKNLNSRLSTIDVNTVTSSLGLPTDFHLYTKIPQQ
ncbi:MAG: Abi family protein [Anaerorhabdus sp.]